MIIGADVGFVVHLHQHVAPATIEQPAGGGVGGPQHGGLILELLVLAEIEIPQNDGHAQFIRRIQHPAHAVGERWPQRAVGIETTG